MTIVCPGASVVGSIAFADEIASTSGRGSSDGAISTAMDQSVSPG
jgi:hypothetical protein